MAKRQQRKKLDEVFEDIAGVSKPLREVKALLPAVWASEYDYVQQYGHQELLPAIYEAVDAGYTPDEIYHQLKRSLPVERERLAVSAKNAAYKILYDRGEIDDYIDLT